MKRTSITRKVPFFVRARRRSLFTNPQLERRLRLLDRRLDLKPGHGFADVVMGDAISSIIGGDTSCILDGWEMEDPGAAALSINALGRRWAREDTTLNPAR